MLKFIAREIRETAETVTKQVGQESPIVVLATILVVAAIACLLAYRG